MYSTVFGNQQVGEWAITGGLVQATFVHVLFIQFIYLVYLLEIACFCYCLYVRESRPNHLLFM